MTLANSFQHLGVAQAYVHRPPYPAALFDFLETLMVAGPRHVLDLGAGEGALARPLAPRVERVDAVEMSEAMVDAGRPRPGGDHPNLSWILSAAETAPLNGPYSLAVAGESLHWMDAGIVLPRISTALAPGAVLAIIDRTATGLAWRKELVEVIVRHSRSRDYDPSFSLPDSLERQGLFEILGRHETEAVEFRQPVDDYVEYFHSTSSLARELMSPQEAQRFGEQVRRIVSPHADARGDLILPIVGSVVWGRTIQ